MGSAVPPGRGGALKTSAISRFVRYLPALVRGRPLHSRDRYRPFFIVGSGRCGTTLLRAMLQAHPDVHIPPETYVLGNVVRDWRRYSRLPWNAVLRLVLGQFVFHPHWEAFQLTLEPLFRELNVRPSSGRNLAAVLDAVYTAHARQCKPAASRWGDKTPANTFVLPDLNAVFPDLRVIHLLRDGRDVVGSFVRIEKHDLSVSARHWLRSVREARAFGANHPARYLEIRYEDLVRRTRDIIERVVLFLDVPFDERMTRHHELDLHLPDVDQQQHLRGAREPVHQRSIGRWRSEFDPHQLAELHRLLGSTLAELGYGAA